jgi:hypothetical protein
VFADLDAAIRQLLIDGVPLEVSEVDVSFEAPDRDWSGRLTRPTVNCFLYDVRENMELRNTGRAVQRQNGVATVERPHLRIDATYQVTVWARAPEDEHHLLWRVLSALAGHTQLPDAVLHGGLRDQPFPIPTQTAHSSQLRSNPADLWQAVDNRIRPALTYVVTLALDPNKRYTAPIVFTRVLRVLDSADEADAELFELAGRVRSGKDAEEGVEGALVRVRESGFKTTTDAQGRFLLRRARRGPITLEVRAPRREEIVKKFDVPATTYDIEV